VYVCLCVCPVSAQVFRLPQLMLDAPEMARVLAKARAKLLDLYGDLEKVGALGATYISHRQKVGALGATLIGSHRGSPARSVYLVCAMEEDCLAVEVFTSNKTLPS